MGGRNPRWAFGRVRAQLQRSCPRPLELHVGAGNVGGEEDPLMEQAIISGVTHDTSEAKVTIARVPDRPGIAAQVFRALADEAVNVDMIVQNVSTAGHTDISFTVPATICRGQRK